MNDDFADEQDEQEDHEPKAPEQAPFSENDFRVALDVLEAVVRDRAVLAHVPREARVRLLEAAGRVSRPDRAEQRRLAKALRRKDRLAVKAEDAALLDATGIRAARRAPVFQTPPPSFGVLPGPTETPPPAELTGARKCYVCKAEFRRVHFFYDQLCPPCAELNYQKRTQTADLRGRVALVTGARVKIGYQAAILLLRAGARVVVTTRFPHDAALRYARESDYEAWADRLEIHGLDLRLTPSVERFARFLEGHLPRLDFIIHNACQTVRRPPGFYEHLLDIELQSPDRLPPEAARLVASHEAERAAQRAFARANDAALAPRTGSLALFEDPVALSQIPLTAEDHALRGRVDLFPRGALDADLQQKDLRDKNSWRLALAEVPTIELLEVHLVNAIAPFVLSSKLKGLMTRHPTRDKHIVNVSAMEGQFYREHKTDKHPHTNMAKAALNMLTRTSAQDYVKDGIHINSVDTGWVTDEDPAEIAVRKQSIHGFHPPLDIVDGAARIVDPIFEGFATGIHAYGQFFKDYKPTPW
ncbi:SDR family NAD(P)-dependent oxidoreductase [Polyangium jinanense]|uniref:SDR family oxidoreductase n=1 Tax=Polyangium jinanense TaxID=2829994 RepID=A0A9X3XC14_9BACT|nr:SDR family oxidoreductase [Polyangium jinanense]MDC3987732.1 SDR family oxidoreductase [Polyangium jinanense]